MSYAIQSRSARADGLRGTLRTMLGELAGAWRYAVARREFNRLDASTLRDLGMTRGEFDSYWAEAHGQAQQTRQRVLRNLRGRCVP